MPNRTADILPAPRKAPFVQSPQDAGDTHIPPMLRAGGTLRYGTKKAGQSAQAEGWEGWPTNNRKQRISGRWQMGCIRCFLSFAGNSISVIEAGNKNVAQSVPVAGANEATSIRKTMK